MTGEFIRNHAGLLLILLIALGIFLGWLYNKVNPPAWNDDRQGVYMAAVIAVLIVGLMVRCTFDPWPLDENDTTAACRAAWDKPAWCSNP